MVLIRTPGAADASYQLLPEIDSSTGTATFETTLETTVGSHTLVVTTFDTSGNLITRADKEVALISGTNTVSLKLLPVYSMTDAAPINVPTDGPVYFSFSPTTSGIYRIEAADSSFWFGAGDGSMKGPVSDSAVVGVNANETVVLKVATLSGLISASPFSGGPLLDVLYGDGGFANVDNPQVPNGYISGVGLQPGTNKIVSVGSSDSSTGVWNVFAIRQNGDGGTDPTFGNGGAYSLPSSSLDDGNTYQTFDLEFDSAGNLFYTAYSYQGVGVGYVAKLRSSGVPATDFGQQSGAYPDRGWAPGMVALSGSNPYASMIDTLTPGGPYIVSGGYDWQSGTVPSLYRRSLSSGTPDTSFGANGVVEPALPAGDIVIDLAQDSSGKYLGVDATANGFSVFRFDPATGLLDSSFGTSGKSVLYAPSFSSQVASSLVVQPSGKILVAGSGVYAGSYFPLVVRLNTDGTVDSSFGGGTAQSPARPDDGANRQGWVSASALFAAASVTNLVREADGNYAALFAYDAYVYLWRFTTDGELISFSSVDVSTFFPRSLAIDDLGRFVVGGNTVSGGLKIPGTVRILP